MSQHGKQSGIGVAGDAEGRVVIPHPPPKCLSRGVVVESHEGGVLRYDPVEGIGVRGETQRDSLEELVSQLKTPLVVELHDPLEVLVLGPLVVAIQHSVLWSIVGQVGEGHVAEVEHLLEVDLSLRELAIREPSAVRDRPLKSPLRLEWECEERPSRLHGLLRVRLRPVVEGVEEAKAREGIHDLRDDSARLWAVEVLEERGEVDDGGGGSRGSAPGGRAGGGGGQTESREKDKGTEKSSHGGRRVGETDQCHLSGFDLDGERWVPRG